MPLFADLDDTPPLDDGDANGDGNSFSSDAHDDDDQGMMLEGETLGIETERVMDDSILYGETQAVDDDDDDDGGIGDGNGENGIVDDGIETQIETQAVDDDDDDDDDGIEGTEVAADDDEAWVPRDRVDSDASTDDDAGNSKGDFVSSELPPSGGSCKSNNGSVRSIASVRAASLRSSGLAAAKSMASKEIVIASKLSFSNGKNCNDRDNGVVGVEISVCPNSSTNLTFLDTTVGAIVTDHEIDNSKRGAIVTDHEIDNSKRSTRDYHRDESKSRKNNPVVKKFLYETEEETASEPSVAGLSYLTSQEPGDLSQANALDVVDKFLGINYLGLSQEDYTEKNTDIVKSSVIPSAKGAQLLVKKTDHRSPVTKKGSFEWIDGLEDDGGGEFFTRRRDSFFKRNDGACKSRSQPPKANNGDNLKSHRKIANLTCSDSRLLQNGSLMKGKVHVAGTRTKKNLFRDQNEQLNPKSLERQLEFTDIEQGGKGTYEVGPDTQIAAEAMEALVVGSPLNNKTPSNSARRRDTTSKPALLRKSTFCIPNSEDVVTRSKQRKGLSTKSKQRGSPICSRSNSNGKTSLDCTTETSVSKLRKKKLNSNTDAKSLVNENECSGSSRHSMSKEFIPDEFHVNSTPIAHRTRHSKASILSKVAENVATDYGNVPNLTVNLTTCGAVAKDDKLMEDTTGSRTTKRKYSNNALVQNAGVEREFMAQDIDGHIEEAKASSVKSSFTHPKRRRTRRSTPDNPITDYDPKNLSLFNDNVQPRTGKRKAATFKTVSELLDAAKRKRRSISTRTASKIDGLTSGGEKFISISGVRTRSSLKCPLDKPNVENASTNPCSTSPLEQGAYFNGEVEVAEDDKDKAEGLASPSPLKDVDAVSPVCAAQVHPRTPANNGRSRSLIARELIRLEASKSSPTSMFNTRRRKDIPSVRALFSHHLDDDIIKQQKKIMARLGVLLASSILDATHFVTDYFVRTRNMLEAMALGKPVVTRMWLESCGQAGCFIDEKNYILRDAKKEREIGFSMPVSLARAFQNPLLQGRRVYITPNAKPSREVISSLVKAAHGQPMERLGRSTMKDDKILNDLLVLSCEEDYTICIPLLEKGAEIFSSELLLNGIVVQKLEFERHKLFSDHIKRTRSTIWLRREDDNQFLPVAKYI